MNAPTRGSIHIYSHTPFLEVSISRESTTDFAQSASADIAVKRCPVPRVKEML
jgi:hypothetical protein